MKRSRTVRGADGTATQARVSRCPACRADVMFVPGPANQPYMLDAEEDPRGVFMVIPYHLNPGVLALIAPPFNSPRKIDNDNMSRRTDHYKTCPRKGELV